MRAKTQPLSGRRVLVTGGAVRLGRAMVLALSDAGADVVIHARHAVPEARALVARLRRRGRRAWQVCGALETPAGAAAVWRDACAAAGRIDGLVNNAAAFARRDLRRCGAADFDAMWQVNALAPMLLTRLLARGARSAVAGVVNILDQRIARPAAGCIPYLVSKHALAAFTAVAALELAPRVRVNAVAPGACLAPVSPEGREPAGPVPLGRRCTPEEIAAAVVFLLASPSITGQILYVDGGQHLVSGQAAGANEQ